MIKAQSNIRVLIVDDMPLVRQGLAAMLRLATKNVTPVIDVIGEAQDGNEAVELAKVLAPDVILMDLEMPVMNGYIATQNIKSDDPSTFIIILTIYDDLPSRQKAAQVGADAFFDKSAPLESLVHAIQDYRSTHVNEGLS